MERQTRSKTAAAAAGRAQRPPRVIPDAAQPRAQPAYSHNQGPGGESQSQTEEIDDDDLCPICQLLLHEPVTTTCRHTLCNFCMATWATTSLAEPTIIVDVDEEPVAFDPVSDLEARCPMCRTLTSAQPDAQRDQALRSKYPQACASRDRETLAEQISDSPSAALQALTVHIGNRHDLVPPSPGDLAVNQHEWSFFVKPSRIDIIEEIHIFLHPTFPQNHIICTRPPYAVSRVGWGTFTLTASIILKPGYSWVSEDAQDSPDGAVKGKLPLKWKLDFEGFGGKGSMGRCRLKVRNDRSWEGVGAEEQRDQREWRRTIRQYERDGRYVPQDD
ncbi:hypothetical protein Q7P37_010147 [Cladosporium fusiforme]